MDAKGRKGEAEMTLRQRRLNHRGETTEDTDPTSPVCTTEGYVGPAVALAHPTRAEAGDTETGDMFSRKDAKPQRRCPVRGCWPGRFALK